MSKTQTPSVVALAAFLLAGSLCAQQSEPPAVPAPPVTAPAAAAVYPPSAAATPASAPAAPAAAAAERPGAFVRNYGMSWREAWGHGGAIMWVLLALSIFGGALVIYFLVVLRPAQVAPRPLLGEVLERLQAGDFNAARRACENRACALSSVTLTALDYIRGVSRTDVNLLRDMIESEGSRQAEDMQSQTQFLLDVAVIAPMLGLLGTVLGMLKAFGSVAHDVAAAKPVILAEGVSQAIITTIFGLMVAIPCMAFYSYFRRRASRIVSLLETASTEVLTALTVPEQP